MTAPVRTIEAATIRRAGVALTSPVPPPPRPFPGGPADLALQPMTVAGTVHAVLYNREGLSDGLVLDDGTTARIPPRSAVERLNLKVGDRVTISGRGSVTTAGRGMRAESIALPNGAPLIVDTPPPVPTALSRDGTVQRLFTNPHGDVDLVLLSDGSAVRIPPTSMAVAAKLTAGQVVHVEGDAVGAALHAKQVRLQSGEVVVTESSVPPPPPPPDSLSRVEDSSTIARVLHGPRGDVDALILASGTIVHLPRRLADDATPLLAVGTRIHVEGEGGRYALGTSLHADTLRLDSGQTFSDPGPAGGRPPPPPVGAPPSPAP
jgi:hypothetical protein